MTRNKTFILLFLISITSIIYYYALDEHLSFSSLKNNQQAILAHVQDNFWQSALIYFVTYILVATLSIPGATVLTLAGGAIFGFSIGLIMVSFASTIGASLAFLGSRYFFKSWIQKKYSHRLYSINQELKTRGIFYLFVLRLTPIFPFFIINLLFGLTNIKTTTFFWVSQIGMLAGTIVFVNAGTQLSQLESMQEILSFQIIGSFVLLALLPIISKLIIKLIQHHIIYKKFTKPKKFDNNLIIIGAGAGGLVSAYIGSTLKAKVTLIEDNKMGGDCLNSGCVPSKTLIKLSQLLWQIKLAPHVGIKVNSPEIEFSEIMQQVQNSVKSIAPNDSIERYTKLGVNVITGKATIKTPYEVMVNGKTLTTKNIIIATGASPTVPKIPGINDIKYLTSDNIWNLKTLPKQMLILGGGVMGCEFAQAFSRLGSKVTIIEKNRTLLDESDFEVAAAIQQKFKQEGIKVICNAQIKQIRNTENTKELICVQKNQTLSLEFDEILLAIGRTANISGFGIEEMAIETQGSIVTDKFMATNYPNIFAVGDVTGKNQLTNVAAEHAWHATVNALLGFAKKFKYNAEIIPTTIFCSPEIAQVGLNEKIAIQKNIAYEVTNYNLKNSDRAICENKAFGWIKILTIPKKDTILGVTIVGAQAGEMLPEFVIAMKHNLGLNKILGTIHAYPTWSEANKHAAGNWRKQNTSPKILKLLEKLHYWRIN